jgi:hypothetical protein
MFVRLPQSCVLAAIALLTGCAAKSGDVGALDDAGASDSMSGSSAGESGEEETTTGTGGDTSGAPSCDDIDGDDVGFDEDNADHHYNPSQADGDADGLADAIDLCPTVGGDPSNTADSDQDGVGNACDRCRQTVDAYNELADEAGVPGYMKVRNVPSQGDADEDGIGDACDNCVWTPNCEGYGGGDPYEIGDPIAYNDPDVCQTDANDDLVGDACEGMMVRPNAAGPVGFGDADDFDQDGITNLLDTCPRHPIADAEMVACTNSDECGDGRRCDDGWCNHVDTDQDAVGDVCDTCSYSANPNQTLEGGAQEDDSDGDFVGSVCETSPACAVQPDPRAYGFHRVQALGNCCTAMLVESTEDWDDPATPQSPDVSIGDLLDVRRCDTPIGAATCPALRAPHPGDPLATLPVRTAEDCPEEQVAGVWVCRQLRPHVAAAAGVLSPPNGCVQALFDAGTNVYDNTIDALTIEDFAGEPNPADALAQHQCFLPQIDQDYDGLGDACDLCPFAYDPDNTQYVDDNGMLWPTDGEYCNGEFLCE